MKKILVTGANGQLGRCINDASHGFSEAIFTFVSRAELNIENDEELKEYFSKNTFDYCINAAGYTLVEEAESDADAAFKTNAEAVNTLAHCCKDTDTVLIHISTDYVFDGKSKVPYTEKDSTKPLSVYGESKLKGEVNIEKSVVNCFIVRTSWLYSQYGNNFLNTILRFAKTKKEVAITTEQMGTPTNANDLAKAILTIIKADSNAYGTYHFSNKGSATWYDFAEAILKFTEQKNALRLVKTDHYRTFAARPAYSVLDTTKFEQTFSFEIREWKKALKDLINSTNL